MSTISAGTTSGTALVNTGDTTGNLVLQVNGTTTSVTLATTGAIGVGSSPSYGSSGQIFISGGSAASPTWTSTLTTPTLTNPTVTNYTETVYTANSSTAITLDLANGTFQNITLTGNATITMPSAVAGKSFLLLLSQDATGGRTVTWSTVVWPSGTAPTITSTASKRDIFSFFSNGTSWFGVTVGQNY
jgi:hypothetical protein